MIYLVFNEGYSASAGDSLTRADLSAEAIRLARLVVELLPEPEAMGLLALMLLQESRRAARTSADGAIVVLEAQDRSLWNRAQIDEGLAWVERALAPRGDVRPRRVRPVRRAGGDRRAARRGAKRRGDRLGRDRRPLRRPGADRSRRRSSRSTAPSRSPCATARRPACR